VFIGVMLYLSNQFAVMIERVETMRWALSTANYIWSFAVTWLFMFAVYMLVPSTKVMARAALVGGFVSAAMLSIGKSSLDAYFSNAVSLESLYGSLGAIPLFMFWVYIMWLVVLFGLEVSATIQTLQGRPLEELEQKRPQNGLVDPAAVLAVMELVNERFASSQVAQLREIADETFIPEGIVAQIIDRLVKAGLLHRLEGGDGAVSLACPPDQIPADRLIEIGYSLVDEGGVGRQSALIQRLRAAQTSLAQKTTLASLLGSNTPKPATSQALAR
jgi:membrane protein